MARKGLTAGRVGSAAEEALWLQLRASGQADGCVRQYRFHLSRQWRADFCWPSARLIVEVDGGLFVRGGHSRGAGRERDYARDAAALLLGWRVLRVSPRQVRSGAAAAWIAGIREGR